MSHWQHRSDFLLLIRRDFTHCSNDSIADLFKQREDSQKDKRVTSQSSAG